MDLFEKSARAEAIAGEMNRRVPEHSRYTDAKLG